MSRFPGTNYDRTIAGEFAAGMDSGAAPILCRLDEVASVRLGFTALKPERSSLADAPDPRSASGGARSRGFVQMIQPSNVSEDGVVDVQRLDLVRVNANQSSEAHELHPGAILLCLRGVLRIALLDERTLTRSVDDPNHGIAVVASGAWAVIRPDPKLASADFIAWQLRQRSSISKLHWERGGSASQFIRITAVAELMVSVPDLATQSAFVNALRLIDDVERLDRRRIELLRNGLVGALAKLPRGGQLKRLGGLDKDG